MPNNLLTDNLKYSVHRKDRTDGGMRGGGVCVLCNDATVISIPVEVPAEMRHLDLCITDLYLSHSSHSPIRLFNCYRPPSSNRDPNALQYITDLCNCIERCLISRGSVIITGDLNFPNINWDSANLIQQCCTQSCSGVFLDLVFKHCFSQLVRDPTRNDNLLDLILTNDPNCVINVTVCPPFCTSDHNSVECEIVIAKTISQGTEAQSTYTMYDYSKADWQGIRHSLINANLNDLFNLDMPSDAIFNCFYSYVHDCIHMYVPTKTIAINTKKQTRKYPAKIRKLQQKKLRSWRVYRRLRTSESHEKYKRLAAQCKAAINTYNIDRESKLIDSGNLGSFYQYANKKLTCRSTIGALSDSSGNLITSSTAKSHILNSTFSNNFTPDNNVIPSCPANFPAHQSWQNLSNIVFNSSMVERAIKQMKIKSKGGPDELPPIFLKKCIHELSSPLANLFTLSFEFSYLPPIWSTAFITPIYKKGDRTDPGNYRPIALTSSICKLMERIIKDQLLQYLLTNNFITRNQHAFINKHSTATNLLESVTDWSLALNSGHGSDVVYIDFAKAFDSIVFSKLLNKLSWYGISGNLHNWIANFIFNRTQRVVIDYCCSTLCKVISGVPQGSVLGPILFLIFINDIDFICNGSVTLKLFADDAKLYTEINQSSSLSLQASLDRLSQWAQDWQLTINVKKCGVLHISQSKSVAAQNTTYYINSISLPCLNSISDLGIALSNDLSFNLHINNIVSKATQRAGILFRGFQSRDPLLLRKAFITYIRPLLEYSSIVWNPDRVYLTDLLENVQRKFSKRIPSIAHLSYPDRLLKLNLESLELRRLRFDLAEYYKILSSQSPVDKSRFLIHHPPASSRSTSIHLQKPTKSNSLTLSSFFYRQTHVWNTLPADLKNCDSIIKFRAGLKKLDLHKHLRGSNFKII